MPPDFAHAGCGGQTETHLELVADQDPDEEILAAAPLVLGRSQRCRDDVRRVRRILLPVDVVVIHRPDQEGVHQRGVPEVRHRAVADDRRLLSPAERLHKLISLLHVLVVEGGQRAADRVKQESLGLLDGRLRNLIVLK